MLNEPDIASVTAAPSQHIYSTQTPLVPLPPPSRRSPSSDPTSEARKPRSKAEAFGQVFTAPDLADRMVRGLGLDLAKPGACVLDPCVGPYTFPSAIRRLNHIGLAISAIDIDPDMYAISKQAACNDTSRVEVQQCDYLTLPASGEYDFAILNPPYVRQEWIRHKAALRAQLLAMTGAAVPGTSNLYVYFIVKVLADLRAGGSMACIIYDSWQSTLYGRWLKRYLDENCISWDSDPVPACPFEGRLIDATIIYATKGAATCASTEDPLAKVAALGLARVGDIFSVRRGLRLKQSDFFLTTLDNSDRDGGTPFIKKINKIAGYQVEDEHPEAALLLSATEGDARTIDALNRRLAAARTCPDENISILTWHAERSRVWNKHAIAPRDVILFNYYLRHRPRHILNPGMRAYSDNFYGLTPNGECLIHAWLAAMNATASVVGILANARNQGAGLAKLQLFEYRDAAVVDIRSWSQRDQVCLDRLGRNLANGSQPADELIRDIDLLIAQVMSDPELQPAHLLEKLRNIDYRAKRPR